MLTYEEAERYLLKMPSFAHHGARAYVPGLERIDALMQAMGNPHRAYPTVHVAGTNGKGSTAAFVAAITTALGMRVGLHTSPHLFHLSERLRINGKSAPERWLAENITTYRKDFDRTGASFFETTVALSLLYFADESVDLAVIETGLGGRLDATNIVEPDLVLITSIGFDHTEILGHSLREIAAEKAGIIKPGVPVVSGVEQPEADVVISETADRQKAPLHKVHEETSWKPPLGVKRDKRTAQTPLRNYTSIRPGLPGRHQYDNAMIALRGAELLFPDKMRDVKSVRIGLEQVVTLSGLRGRLEICREEPRIVLDVGHNPDGLRAALSYMKDAIQPGHGRLFVVFGTMRDKDIHSMSAMLAEAGARVFLLPVHSDRALPPAELSLIFAHYGVACERVGCAQEALTLFYSVANPEDGLLVTGSHHVAAQFPELMAS